MLKGYHLERKKMGHGPFWCQMEEAAGNVAVWHGRYKQLLR